MTLRWRLLTTGQPDSGVGVIEFPTTGEQSWVVPVGVTSISVVCIGGGGGGGGEDGVGNSAAAGGGGGALRYVNNIPVTPGETLTVIVGTGGSGGSANPATDGQPGGTSSVSRGATILCSAGGGGGGGAASFDVALGGSTGVGAGGNGGDGGNGGFNSAGGAGGGAAGYTGNGGNGTFFNTGQGGTQPTGGGAGGGGSVVAGSAGGGGTGGLGEGPSGVTAGNTLTGGTGGSSGTDGESAVGGAGGLYGGGGGTYEDDAAGPGGDGGQGTVTIIYPGDQFSFPTGAQGLPSGPLSSTYLGNLVNLTDSTLNGIIDCSSVTTDDLLILAFAGEFNGPGATIALLADSQTPTTAISTNPASGDALTGIFYLTVTGSIAGNPAANFQQTTAGGRRGGLNVYRLVNGGIGNAQPVITGISQTVSQASLVNQLPGVQVTDVIYCAGHYSIDAGHTFSTNSGNAVQTIASSGGSGLGEGSTYRIQDAVGTVTVTYTRGGTTNTEGDALVSAVFRNP